MSLTPIPITIQRETRTGTGSGSKVSIWATVGTALATMNYYRKTSVERFEEATHNSEGPGVQTQTRRLFVLEAPYLDTCIRTNDRVVIGNGTAFKVFFVRVYDGEIQVDTEIVV